MPDTIRLAVIDDEEITCKRLKDLFRPPDFDVETFVQAQPFLQRLAAHPFALVLTDIRLPDLDGMEVLRRVKRDFPATEVILITGYASLDHAVEAVKEGAFYYLAKPFTPAQVQAIVARALEHLQLARENRQLRQEVQRQSPIGDIKGISAKIRELTDAIAKVAQIDCTVLIQGESGTGKELVARALHQVSPRAAKPFVVFNCGGFTEELIGNELFGHDKGAFTGADTIKIGLMEAAQGGTLFMDEIGEMPPSMQVKLLRVIQEKKLLRLGSIKPVNLDIRLITATNRDLAKEVEQGRFRQDLFYRLKVVLLKVPPLRERKEDIPILLNHLLEKYNTSYQKKVQGFSRDALDILMKYSYPGNVRELENIVASAVALSEGDLIRPGDLPEDLNQLEIETLQGTQLPSWIEMERDYLQQVLAATNHNKVRAADILKIPRTTLWRKIRKYGLEKD